MKNFRNNKKMIIAFIFPAMFLYTLIVAYPVGQSFIKSFTNWDGLAKPDFTGLENYIRLFQDAVFKISTINGFKFALVLVVGQIGMGLLLALLLINKRLKGTRVFKNMFFIPVVLSVTVVCQLWLTIYDGHSGLLNRIFVELGSTFQQDWLSDPKVAIWAVAVVNSWQFMGYHLLLFYAAIKAIPEDYFEAAMIDGASTIRVIYKLRYH